MDPRPVSDRWEARVIRVVVERVPGGDESRTRELAQADLVDAPEAAMRISAQYSIAAREGENRLAGSLPWESKGVLRPYDRRESIWKLVELAAAWAAGQAEIRAHGG